MDFYFVGVDLEHSNTTLCQQIRVLGIESHLVDALVYEDREFALLEMEMFDP